MTDRMSMRVFGEADGDLAALRGRTIAVIGYGNQGRAQALNLRDSGVSDIVVGTAEDETWTLAGADGFPVSTVEEAVRAGDVVLLLLPDEVLPEVYREAIERGLRPGDSLVFASGYNLAFGGVSPPGNVDVLLLAPRMIGRQMRELYRQGRGFYSFVSVEQDATGHAWTTLLGLAKGIGTLRGAAFELSARDEAVLDLFHEQGFGSLVGVTIALMLEVGVQAGLPPEALVLDLYLSGEAAQTFQAMADVGFFEQSRLHSRTSQYGGMMRSISLDREPIRQHLLRIIEEVRTGIFAMQWSAEREAGYENFERLLSPARQANPFTPIEQRIRRAIAEAQGRRS
jgi:ketol-acid reductoisomerase